MVDEEKGNHGIVTTDRLYLYWNDFMICLVWCWILLLLECRIKAKKRKVVKLHLSLFCSKWNETTIRWYSQTFSGERGCFGWDRATGKYFSSSDYNEYYCLMETFHRTLPPSQHNLIKSNQNSTDINILWEEDKQ